MLSVIIGIYLLVNAIVYLLIGYCDDDLKSMKEIKIKHLVVGILFLPAILLGILTSILWIPFEKIFKMSFWNKIILKLKK